MLTLEDLSDLAKTYRVDLESAPSCQVSIGNHTIGQPNDYSLMGVINLSADSWYRESVCLSVDQALQRARLLHNQGAQIIDLGAESTVLNAERVSASKQREKLITLIKKMATEGLTVSTETYHPSVARQALKAGAKVINLTSGAHNKIFYELARDHGAAVIICFVAGKNVREVKTISIDSDPIPALKKYFSKQLELVDKVGLEQVILDPGLGFYYRNLQDSAVRVRYQMATFLHSFRLKELGAPLCQALPHAFEFFGEEVRVAESFFAVLAALGKCDLYRTHEVAKVRAVLETLKTWNSPGRIQP